MFTSVDLRSHRAAHEQLSESKTLTRIVDGRVVKITIQRELNALCDCIAREQMTRNLSSDPFIKSIFIWHNNFSHSLRLPNVNNVVKEYVATLVDLFRSPLNAAGIETSFPAELFGDRPIPLVRFLVEKMRDKSSLYYSEEFDREATEILSRAASQARETADRPPIEASVGGIEGIPQDLLDQLRQIEAIHAERRGFERESKSGLLELQNRVRERESGLQERIDRMAKRDREEGQRIRKELERQRQVDSEEREIIITAANRLLEEAERLKGEAEVLQRQLDQNGRNLVELEKAEIQLQAEINKTREELDKNKSNWLVQALCVAASVAISWALQTPVVIIPP